MRTLTIDIETSPALADVWGLWDVNVSLNQLRVPVKVISFAAKWLDNKKPLFYSYYHNGHEEMVQAAHSLLDEADAVVHWNGDRFDTPHLQREFLLAGLTPPSPFHQIDLLKTARKQFKFMSNKLQHVSTQLGYEGKVKHDGHELWQRCLDGDDKAWSLMRRYNINDVLLTEKLYVDLLPWISGHPHTGLYGGSADSCGRCGSDELERRGFKAVGVSTYQQYQCKNCGGWLRGSKALERVTTRSV